MGFHTFDNNSRSIFRRTLSFRRSAATSWAFSLSARLVDLISSQASRHCARMQIGMKSRRFPPHIRQIIGAFLFAAIQGQSGAN